MLKTISSIPIWLPRSLTITFIRFQWNCKDFDGFKNICLYPLIFKNFEALYFSNCAFSRYGFYIPFAKFFILYLKKLKDPILGTIHLHPRKDIKGVIGHHLLTIYGIVSSKLSPPNHDRAKFVVLIRQSSLTLYFKQISYKVKGAITC